MLTFFYHDGNDTTVLLFAAVILVFEVVVVSGSCTGSFFIWCLAEFRVPTWILLPN